MTMYVCMYVYVAVNFYFQLIFVFKLTVQFERCFRLMEHISVNPINLYLISLKSLLNSLNRCLIIIW